MKNWLNLTSILLIFFCSIALNAQASSCGQSARLSYEELNRFAVKLNSAIEAEAIDANRMRFEFAMNFSPLIQQLIKKSFSYRLENEIKEDIHSDLVLYIAEHFQVFYKNGRFSIYHLKLELKRQLWRKYRSYSLPTKTPETTAVDNIFMNATKFNESSRPDLVIQELAQKNESSTDLVKSLLYWDSSKDFRRDDSYLNDREVLDKQDQAIINKGFKFETWQLAELNEFEAKLIEFLEEQTKTNLLERFLIVSVFRMQLDGLKKIDIYLREEGYPLNQAGRLKISRFLKEFGQYVLGEKPLEEVSLFEKPLFVEEKRSEWGFAEALENADLILPHLDGLLIPGTIFSIEKYLGKKASNKLLSIVSRMSDEQVIDFFKKRKASEEKQLSFEVSSNVVGEASNESLKKPKPVLDETSISEIDRIKRVQYESLDSVSTDKGLVETYLLFLTHGNLKEPEVVFSVLILGDYIQQNQNLDLSLRRSYVSSRKEYLKQFKRKFGFSFKSLELKVTSNNRKIFDAYKKQLQGSLDSLGLSENLLFQWYLSRF